MSIAQVSNCATQLWNVTARFPIGTTDEPAMKRASSITLAAGLFALPLALCAQGNLTIEAGEGLVTLPLVVTNGCLAQTCVTNFSQGGRAAYSVTISQPGNYVLLVTVSSPEHASSLAVNVDAEPTSPDMVWDVPVSQEFTNRIVTWRLQNASPDASPQRSVFSLAPGSHQVIFRGGDGAVPRLARFSVVRIPAAPGGLRVLAGP